jgi:glycosyltransferase involved in cell wall biosynthesis
MEIPENTTNRPFVLAFHKVNSGVAYHRVFAPLICHQEADICFIEKITDVEPDMWAKVTHIFASRAFPVEPFDDFVKLCRKENIKLIIDQDDWWVLPPTHPLRGMYAEQMKERIIRSMKAADEVWVTNKHLASKVKKYNSKIRIIPNAISVPTWQVNREPSDKVRFGYIGGNHHQIDVRESTIDLTGYEAYVADVDNYPQMMNASTTIKTFPPNSYHRMYEFFDVSLVPLSSSEFAKCKSHLKMLEAGFSKCALIVSNTHPYSPYITKENCIAIKHPSEWAGAIKRLSENPNQVQDLTEALYDFVQDFTMDKINELRCFTL